MANWQRRSHPTLSKKGDRMQHGSASAGRRAHLLAEAGNLDLSCISPPPSELHVENLRRRGIDVLKISWTEQLDTKSAWLVRLRLAGWGGSKSLSWMFT